jgi:hypothetical protein
LAIAASRLLCALLVAVFSFGAAPVLGTADVAVLRELRPAQRSNVFVVARDGSLRIVYGDGVDVPDAPTPAPLAYVAPHVAPAPKPRLDVVDVRAHPIVPHPLVRLPGYLAFERQAFVPTIAVPKPAHVALRTPARDLAWLYAHRFDQTASGVPGVPVRSQVASPFDIDSGAFHGVRATNGWSAVRVAISIPCGVRHFVTGPGYDEVKGEPGLIDLETGYVYIGGWGAGARGVSVDAGLQKSSAQAERDEYAFYWKFAANKPITSDQRFPCGGPDVVLELYPVSPTQLVFSATGVGEDGERHTLTVVQTTNPDDGWTPDGGSPNDGIILKRIISIAQPWTWHRRGGGVKNDRFTSGSYFGVNGPNDLRPRFVWSRCEVGRVVPPSIVPTYRTWTSNETWTSRVPGIYTDWPPLGVERSSGGACDAAGLYLRA